MRSEFFRQIFEKYTDIKFHVNPMSGSRAVPCGRADEDTTKLMVACGNYANAPNKANNATYLHGTKVLLHKLTVLQIREESDVY